MNTLFNFFPKWILPFTLLCSLGHLSAAIPRGLKCHAADSCFYVDQSLGNDSTAGLGPTLPSQTIGRALELATQANFSNLKSKIIIRPGVYRESLTFTWHLATEAPMSIGAEIPGSVTISGSDIWTGWKINPQNSRILTHSWDRLPEVSPDGLCYVPESWSPYLELPRISRSPDLIFLNRRKLTQVMSRDLLLPGSFYISDPAAPQGQREIFIWMFADTNPITAQIEVAARHFLIDLNGKRKVRVTGLNLEHASGCIQGDGALRVTNAKYITLDGLKVDWNTNGAAIASTEHVTIKNTSFNHNGNLGIGGSTNKFLSLKNVEASYNNWRGAAGANYGWDFAGMKWLNNNSVKFSNVSAHYNLAKGLWFDTENRHVVLRKMSLQGNFDQNIALEANRGPTTISQSRICNGRNGGLLIANSPNLKLIGNVFADNERQQILLGGDNFGRLIPLENGTSITINNYRQKLTNNFISTMNLNDLLIWTGHAGEPWLAWRNSFVSGHNLFFAPDPKKVFNAGPYFNLDFQGWKAATLQDQSSQWHTTSALCEKPEADQDDFWLTSPWDIPSFPVLQQNGEFKIKFDLQNLGGSEKDIQLRLEGLTQANLQGSLSRTQVNLAGKGQGSSILTITSDSTSLLGPHEITLAAYDGIDKVRTVTFILRVVALPQAQAL